MSVALGQCPNHGESQTPVGLFSIDNHAGQLEPAGSEPCEVPFGIRIVQPRNILKKKRFFDLAEECSEFWGRIAVLNMLRLIYMAPAQMVRVAPAIFDPIQILPELENTDLGSGRRPWCQFARIVECRQKSVGD